MDQDLLELFDHAIRVLEELQIPYAIGGSVATLAYGEDRGTRDLDVVILLDDADIPKLLAGFPFRISTRIIRRPVMPYGPAAPST